MSMFVHAGGTVYCNEEMAGRGFIKLEPYCIKKT